MMRKNGVIVVMLMAVMPAVAGCAVAPYRTVEITDSPRTLRLRPEEEQIVRGRSIPVLDRTIGWIWPGSLLGKLVLWDYRVDSHVISEETEQALQDYLEVNEMEHVKVRINAWSVGDEWRRSLRNREIEPWFRYTFGVLNALQYTIFPGRIFGGDNYRPYSNTINLYSDIPAVALHEGGHAKDFGRRSLKGLYAFVYMLPFGALYHEAVATGDALGYLHEHGTDEGLREGYHILYPAYGTYLGSDIASFAPDEPASWIINVSVILGAHMVGRVRGLSVGADAEGP